MTNKLLRKGSMLFALMAFFAMTHSVNAQYCIPGATNASRYINNFSTTNGSENISNLNSGFSTGGYGDFTATQTIAQDPGSSFDFSVDIEGGTAGFRVWVDWNQDGVFDTNEVAYQSGSYAGSHTGTIAVPADAEIGETRMRIVSHWLSSSGNIPPCTTGFEYGEFEDYKVVTGILDACTDAEAGTIVGDASVEVCSNTTFSLSVTGNSEPAEGLIRTWQSSPAGAGTWTDLGAGSSTLTVIGGIDVPTDFRYHVECDNGTSDNSDIISVTLNPNTSECYCVPEGINPDRYINNFSTTGGVQNISNLNSGYSTDGYGDFTSMTVEANPGDEISFTVDHVGGTFGFRIWVDWNQDGMFDITEEVVYNSTSYSATHTGTITLPVGAMGGTTRMRIANHYLSSTGSVDPCSIDFNNGEFEDYTFQIIPLEVCSDAVAGTVVGDTEREICAMTPFSMTVEGISDPATGLIRTWQSSPAGEDTWTDLDVSNATITIAGISSATDYRYHVECENGDSDNSEVISISLNPNPSECYCTPEGTNTNRFVDNFSTTGGIQNISNLGSGFSPEGYGDFTAMTLEANPGDEVSFVVDIAGGTAGFRIWVDWNQDGAFDTTEEVAFSTTTFSSAHSGSLTVPMDAASGDTRMRIVSHWQNSEGLVDPCETGFSYGEFEDYTFNVTGGGGGTFPSPYCDITDADEVIVEAITKVELAGTTITNDDADSVLIDKTATIVNVMAGETYTLSVEGDTAGDFDNNIVAFIDWNQNDILDDAGEIYELGTLSNSTGADGISVSMEIEVPADAVLGETRIRITKTYFDDISDAIVTPCGIQFDPFGMGIFPGYGQALDFTLNVEESDGGDGIDCAQGDDSNGFENGFNITAGTDFRNADDFMVSADNTLNIRSIELNILAMAPIASFDFNFYNDDNGTPGTTVVESLTAQVPYSQVAIGSAFGYTVYNVLIEVDLNFDGGATGTTFWMQPVSNGDAFWEVSTVGTLGEPIHTSEVQGPWEADEDGAQGVFKLHCDVVGPPPFECLFTIDWDVEPITRFVMANVDNASSVSSTEALEDFTDITIMAEAGGTIEVAVEGYTGGAWTNYFTVFINTDSENEWTTYETFEIGSITNSTGTDGMQATATIVLPGSLTEGEYLLRVVKNFNESPLAPCGAYGYGQAEDYTLVIGEMDDCAGTPDGGIVTVNPETGNVNTSYTVSATDYSFANGITYQWQSNTDGAGWEDEGNLMDVYSSYAATAPSENDITVEWRLEVTCTLSGETSYSETATFTTTMVYCTPVLLCDDGDLITNVSFQEIENATGCSPDGYGDYTDMVATVQSGGTYPISVTVGGGFTSESVSVWIDFDNSGSFDENEFYYIGTGSASTVSGDIAIPAGAADGNYRMRVRVAATDETLVSWDLACDNDVTPYGETEDYTVTVDGVVGVNDNSISNFTYYPNPMVDVLYISAKENVKSVSAYNVLGQEVLSSRHFANGQVDVSSLPTGTYTFRVTFQNGLEENFKALKK